jgi:transposase
MARDDHIDLWAIDEVHFQQHGSRCRMWIPPEDKDPIVLHHPTRKGVGYFGAVRLRDGRFVFRREEERFTAETFFCFMKYLRKITAAARRRIIIISDNARYHHGRLHKDWRERNHQKFALEFLPPYSPDMNPIERLWKLTRRQATHNRYFPSLEDLIHAVETLFRQWRNGNDTLRKLCAIT